MDTMLQQEQKSEPSNKLSFIALYTGLCAAIIVVLWVLVGPKYAIHPVFGMIENGERAWYMIIGSRIQETQAPENYHEVFKGLLREGDFSPTFAKNGTILALSPEGLVAIGPLSETRTALIERKDLDYGSSAIGHTANTAALFNAETNQIDVFSLDEQQAFVLSYDGSIDAPSELYGVGVLEDGRVVVRTGEQSFEIYEISEGAMKMESAKLSLGTHLTSPLSFFAPKVAHAWTYGNPLSGTNAVTSSGTRCTGAQVASLGSASGSGVMPSVQTTVWNYMGPQSGLPANYNNGSYCIQAYTNAIPPSGGGGGGGGGGDGGESQVKNKDAFGSLASLFFPLAHAQSGSWSVTYSIHSGAGTTAASNYYALTYGGASAVPTVELTASPSTVYAGSSAALTWSATNATSCTGAGFSTGGATSGTVSVSPSVTTTYSVSCTGTGGSASDSADVVVLTAQCGDGGDNDGDGLTDMSDPGCTSPTDASESNPQTSGDVTVDLSASETVVSSGLSSLLSWVSSGASYCTGSTWPDDAGVVTDNFVTANTVSGTDEVTPTAAVTDYGLFCYGSSTSGSGGSCINETEYNPTCNTTQELVTKICPEGYRVEISEIYDCPLAPNNNPLGFRERASCVPDASCGGGSSGGFASDLVTITTTSACVSEYQTQEWYTGGTQVGSAFEMRNEATDCTTIFPGPGTYTHWNRQVVDVNYGPGPEEFDPIRTTCTYFTGATGLVSKPNTSDTAYDSGTECSSPTAECSDGADNDGDGRVDYPNDPGCTGPTDPSEPDVPQCSDGVSNDSDGLVDCADPGCWTIPGDSNSCNPNDDDEDTAANAPTVSLVATPSSLLAGGSSLLTWDSQNATSCSGTGFSTGGAADNSSGVSTGALFANANYQIICTGPGGQGSDAATVLVTDPEASISANPDRVTQGSSTNVTWTTSLCTAVSVTKNGAPFSTAPSGTNVPSGPITSQTEFEVVCDGGAARDTVIVNIVPDFEEF